MKKVLPIVIAMLLVSNWATAQVLTNFESDDGGFKILNWSTGVSAVAKATDPTGASTGALKISFDANLGANGHIHKEGVKATAAPELIYWVYLPDNMPDDAAVTIFCQDKNSWDHNSAYYSAKDIPKKVWYPLSFGLKAANIKKPTKFDPAKYDFGWFGLQIDAGATKWKGDIYIDNVSLTGVEPTNVANFEADASGYAVLNWSTGVSAVAKAADPTSATSGALKVSFDANLGANGHINKDGVKATSAITLTYWVYLPDNVPNDAALTIFCQDKNSWDHNTAYYSAADIPKKVWYPLTFGLKAANIKKPTKFDPAKYDFGWFGLQIDAGATKWKGDIYVDNVQFWSTETGSKWVVNTFESVAGGTQGWGTWFGAATVSIAQALVNQNGVLKLSLDFDKGSSDNKSALQKGNVMIYSTELKKAATAISLDVFLPADLPTSGQVGIIANGPEGGWNESAYQIVDAATGTNQIVRGKWQTITIDIAALIASKAIADPTKNITVGIQVYHPAAAKWKGDIYFDNLTVYGIPEPKGTVASPKTTGQKVAFTMQNGVSYEYVRFDWVDNTLGTESYNLYRSEKAITDLKSADVIKVATGIPHGLQKYGHRAWTTDGATKSYYFAITSFDGVNETALTDQCKVGPISVKTSKTYKVQYVKDFAKKFVLDGLDDEFTAYKANQIVPESAGNARGPKWTSTSTDMNFKTTLVCDDKYLYISAAVDDDDLRTDAAQQAWEGDALEFYMGIFDLNKMKDWPEKNAGGDKGVWRVGFNCLGQTTKDGGAATTIAGLDATTFQKFTGDGYIIEAKMELAKFAPGGAITITNAMVMPLRIDGNDWDPTKGDASRGLIVQAGGMPTTLNATPADDPAYVNLDEDWKRSAAWGRMEVIGGTDVANNNSLPTEYALYNNYPNPFNPSTTLKYDLPKESQVTLKIYDILGREVATLVNMKQAAGRYQYFLNASKLASGVYIYRLTAGDFVQTMKMMLMK